MASNLATSTVGAKVFYAVDTAVATDLSQAKHSSGLTWIEIPNVSEAPEISLETEALDASDITDKITRYIPGRQDPGGSASFTLNLTDSLIETWDGLVTAASNAWDEGKLTWIAYYMPGTTNAFYYAGIPQKLGTDGISQNEVATVSGSVIVAAVEGWTTAETFE